ncbi:MAG: hypothetical protein Q7K55_02440, partial [Candidatus Levybacteria bacterium]|nr:hypothetical protein [Candidatus Levybacteria bacterium]
PVLFSKSRGNTIDVNNLAKWFGIKYLFLEDKLDPIEKYKNDPENWKLVDKAGVWQFDKAPEMYSWTVRKPALLVIGSKVKRAFEPFFRVSVNGGFSYDDGWLVPGKENVDDYSLDELKKFDTLVLFGYSYKNRGNAFNMLSKYVKEGGNLFISSGWQYVDKDWKIKKAPEFFPVEDLEWSTKYDKNSHYLMEDKEIGGNIDLSKFSPLEWSNQAWGVSVPSTGKREWARTVLSVDGKPLVVVGKYGNGKVMWTGINWPGHISTYNFNKEEMKFFNNILRYLSETGVEDEKLQTQKMQAIRNYPDKVTFIFNDSTTNNSTLYWRESQFENWHAKLINAKGETKDIKIYKAGPGLMLMRLPPIDSKSKLLLEFSTGLRTLFGRVISVLTLLGLLLYVIFGEKLFKFLTSRISLKLKNRLPKTKISMLKWLNTSEEEEKY